jgi:hypothetical protein
LVCLSAMIFALLCFWLVILLFKIAFKHCAEVLSNNPKYKEC